MSSSKKLLAHFVQFIGGSTLSLLLGFITFPILTRLLSREDYGILGLVTNTIAIAVAIAKAGLSDGIIRFYRDYATSPERLTLFTSTVLTRGTILAAIVTGAYILLLPQINALTGVDPRYLPCFLIVAIYLFVRPLNIIVLNYLRALGDILRYNIVTFLTKAIGIVLALGLLLWVIGELPGYFLGIALAEVVATVYLYYWLLSRHRFSIHQVSGPLAFDLLKFGLPLLLTELAYLLLSYTDRYMIVAFHGESALGLYTVGYTIPAYINDLVMFSLSYAVIPIYTDLYVREGREATEKFLSRSLHYYLMGVIPLCAGYAATTNDIMVFLASPKYSDASAFSPIILVGLVCLGMNSMLYAGLYLQKKSKLILTVMLTAVITNIAANLVLLPRFGAMGAAFASLSACATSSLLMAILARPYLRVYVPLTTIFYYTAASGAMYLLISRIETGIPLLNLAIKIPIGAAVVGVAALWREVELREQVLLLLDKVRRRIKP